MRFLFVISFLIFSQIIQAQDYPFKFSISYQHPDSIKSEYQNDDYQAFIDLSEPSHMPLFHLKGTTLPTPFSPVYDWDLFIAQREYIELNATDEIGNVMALTFGDTLNPGIYNIHLDGLWSIEKPTYLHLEAKSQFKSSIIKTFFWGTDNLFPPEDGLIIRNISTYGILDDSLSISSTIEKHKPHHLKGWILNLPERRQVTFQLYQLPDSTWMHYETLHLKPGLHEITINTTISSGKYLLNIDTQYGKIEEEFYYIK